MAPEPGVFEIERCSGCGQTTLAGRYPSICASFGYDGKEQCPRFGQRPDERLVALAFDRDELNVVYSSWRALGGHGYYQFDALDRRLKEAMKLLELSEGDVIVRKYADGRERDRLQVGGYTSRGKLILCRESGTTFTAWWRSPASLPPRHEWVPGAVR